MKKIVLIVSFLIPGLYSFSIENHNAGARSRALSDAFISVSDVWSSFHNPAGIAGWQNVTAGFYYESRYMIDELSLAAGTVLVPVKHGNFGISFYQFGKSSFKENKFALAYALSLSTRLKASVQLDYFNRRLPENERTKGCATFETGIIFQPLKKLFIGAHIFNPVGAGTGQTHTLINKNS